MCFFSLLFFYPFNLHITMSYFILDLNLLDLNVQSIPLLLEPYLKDRDGNMAGLGRVTTIPIPSILQIFFPIPIPNQTLLRCLGDFLNLSKEKIGYPVINSNNLIIHYKKITVLQRIFPLRIHKNPLQISISNGFATELFCCKKPCYNFAHFGIRLQKTNGFATELFCCYIATDVRILHPLLI